VLRTQGVLPIDVPLLVVEDACPDVGSGGSTLNALLVVVEHLCAQRGFTVLNEHVLKGAKILVIHLVRVLFANLKHYRIYSNSSA
jgi:hypothetical protein